jgi:eukaryotic-like serine/threonine-protein kinase
VSSPTVAPGAVIGRYRVIAPIARGGMGGIWEVEDDAGRRFALKAPVEEIDGGTDGSKRFAREVNALRVLDHPNLVAAVEAFIDGGTLYLVMERVEGTTLTKAIAGGPLAPRRALVLTRQILTGLSHAHGHGIAHRDLKPDNVMLVQMTSASGTGVWEQAKLLDFGLVKLMGDAAALFGGAKLTRTGMVAGTPMYMAPEQALGRDLDGRCDLYALGVILFEMLIGKPPFVSEDVVAMMKMHVRDTPPRVDAASGGAPWATPAVVALVEGALVKNPNDRFATADAMIAAVDHAFASIDHLG